MYVAGEPNGAILIGGIQLTPTADHSSNMLKGWVLQPMVPEMAAYWL